MRRGSGSVWRCSSPSPERDPLLGGGLAPAMELPRVKSLGCLEVVRLFRSLRKTVGTRSARRPALRPTFNLNRWAAFRPTCPFLSTAGFMAGPPIRLTRRHGTTTFGSISPTEAAGCRFQEYGRHRSQTTQPAPLPMAGRPHPPHLHAKELSSSRVLRPRLRRFEDVTAWWKHQTHGHFSRHPSADHQPVSRASGTHGLACGPNGSPSVRHRCCSALRGRWLARRKPLGLKQAASRLIMKVGRGGNPDDRVRA